MAQLIVVFVRNQHGGGGGGGGDNTFSLRIGNSGSHFHTIASHHPFVPSDLLL